MCKRRVVIDADFTKMLCDVDIEDFFERFMGALDVSPVVSWYVAKAELFDCPEAISLIERGVIVVITPEKLFDDEVDMKVFDSNVRSVALKVNDCSLSANDDIFSERFHSAGKNLGEIISEFMAKEMGLSLFASNDRGAKRYASTYINSSSYQLEVKNIIELLDCIVEKGKCSLFGWREIKHLLHEPRWRNDRDRLREKWVPQTAK